MNSYKAHMKKETRQTGFTLVELLVTLAVLITTLAIGVPMYSNMVAHNRTIALTNAFSTGVNLAKSEAIGRGSSVFLCANGACDGDDSDADWNNGWFVFEDAGATADQYDASDVLLKNWPAVEKDMRVYSTATSLTFDYAGALEAGEVEFVMSEADSTDKIQTTLAYVRCININASGRIKQEKPTSGDNGSFTEGTTTLVSIVCP
jgi:type IV fimbrial biogenesis protein FimT